MNPLVHGLGLSQVCDGLGVTSACARPSMTDLLLARERTEILRTEATVRPQRRATIVSSDVVPTAVDSRTRHIPSSVRTTPSTVRTDPTI